jgi:hypothetical protein
LARRSSSRFVMSVSAVVLMVFLSCSGAGGADRGRLRREGVDGQPAMVKFLRTTLEMGFSLPVISAGAVPLT